ncbi:MAG: hypothetical protein DI551_03330 [Micavibrio aeruginosavorus]|uniref:Uncharacterized protein n=1 Tax=Micavibrio aeruginosavorus TaxID=349221 RepID=A0A2W5N444_9BACT|nr:MAG: hypothetical protein DI551_03330 [Micavibrio aeruginosavorus]
MKNVRTAFAALGLMTAAPAVAQDDLDYDVSAQIDACFEGMQFASTDDKEEDSFDLYGDNATKDAYCGFNLHVGDDRDAMSAFAVVNGKGTYTLNSEKNKPFSYTMNDTQSAVATDFNETVITYRKDVLNQVPEAEQALETLTQNGKIAVVSDSKNFLVVKTNDPELAIDSLPEHMMMSAQALTQNTAIINAALEQQIPQPQTSEAKTRIFVPVSFAAKF